MRSILVALVLVTFVLSSDVSSPDDKKPRRADDKPMVVNEEAR